MSTSCVNFRQAVLLTWRLWSEADKTLMWDRWQKGDALVKIAQLFDRTHGSVSRILRRTGGIRPPKRTRSRRTLSLAEREEISRGVVAGRSLRSNVQLVMLRGWLSPGVGSAEMRE
jgi:hypothetical protein